MALATALTPPMPCCQKALCTDNGWLVVNICAACYTTKATQLQYATAAAQMTCTTVDTQLQYVANLIKYISTDLPYKYVYRVLNEYEKQSIFNANLEILPNASIQAKAKTKLDSIFNHVGYGSKGNISQYISTCADIGRAVYWADFGLPKNNPPKIVEDCAKHLAVIGLNNNNPSKYIVTIDVKRLTLNNVVFIDLTVDSTRQFACGNGTEAYRFARAYCEVLVVGDIPASCIKQCDFRYINESGQPESKSKIYFL